jgi:protein-export SecD/SecF family membrane protein
MYKLEFMNKIKIYILLALLPLLLSAFFVTFSQKEIADKLPFRDLFTSITKSTEEYLTSRFPFKLGLDLSSGVKLIYNVDTSKVEKNEVSEAVNVLRDVIERRVNVFGVSEPLVTPTSDMFTSQNRLLVELPGLTNVEDAIKLIGETPTLEFQLVNGTSTLSRIGLDGRYLKTAQVVFDPQTNIPLVSIEWNDTGSAIFASTTKNNIGKPLAIILDGNLISAPIIQSEIVDGKAVITGNFTRIEAKELVSRLNTGALPLPINVEGSEVVQPVLGAKALSAGIYASIIGFLLIVMMMIFWYRLPGVVGVVSLFSYVFIVLAIFKIFGVTLSAAAIAGFLISIGLAVDGNILTFERLKEELNKGKNLKDGIEEAFGRAWTSIRDSNIASLIAAIILFFIGTSVVKGFALTLMIGVVVSMFTNVFITRHLLRGILEIKSLQNKKSWFKSLL